MKVWVACTWRAETDKGRVWELIGVFSSEEQARDACIDGNDGYGALELDAVAPRETSEAWPYGFHYPTRNEEQQR